MTPDSSFSPSSDSSPNFVVLPPADPSEPASSGGELPPLIQALVRNPLVLAGGAVLLGVVASRFLLTPSAKRMAQELAAEAFRHLRPVGGTAAGVAGTAVATSLLEKGLQQYGPQIADYAKKLLADLLQKKQ